MSSVDGELGRWGARVSPDRDSGRAFQAEGPGGVSAESRNVPIRLKHEAPGANVRDKSENSANRGSP